MLTMLDTNVKGLMMVTRHILPSMVAANEGHIINMGSTAGIYAYAGAAVYSATKAAVKTFSDGLRIDTIATDIKVPVGEVVRAFLERAIAEFNNGDLTLTPTPRVIRSHRSNTLYPRH